MSKADIELMNHLGFFSEQELLGNLGETLVLPGGRLYRNCSLADQPKSHVFHLAPGPHYAPPEFPECGHSVAFLNAWTNSPHKWQTEMNWTLDK